MAVGRIVSCPGQETATPARITRAVGALGERRVIGDFLLSPLCVFG